MLSVSEQFNNENHERLALLMRAISNMNHRDTIDEIKKVVPIMLKESTILKEILTDFEWGMFELDVYTDESLGASYILVYHAALKYSGIAISMSEICVVDSVAAFLKKFITKICENFIHLALMAHNSQITKKEKQVNLDDTYSLWAFLQEQKTAQSLNSFAHFFKNASEKTRNGYPAWLIKTLPEKDAYIKKGMAISMAMDEEEEKIK